MKNKKKYPSKEFWILYIICLFILFYIGLKNGAKIDLVYIIVLPIANFILTIIIVILHYFIDMILGNNYK